MNWCFQGDGQRDAALLLERPWGMLRLLHEHEPQLLIACIAALGCGRAAARLDQTCRWLRAIVSTDQDCWMAKASWRFGVELCRQWAVAQPNGQLPTGKDVWKVGLDLVLNLSDGDAAYEELLDEPEFMHDLAGTCIQASCERFLVLGSDDDGLDLAPLLVRSVTDLSVVKRLPDCHVHYVAIFGPEDSPLVALNSGQSNLRIRPIEGPAVTSQEIIVGDHIGNADFISCLLGSSTCLVVGCSHGHRLHVKAFDLSATELLDATDYAEVKAVCISSAEFRSSRTQIVSMAWAQPFGPRAYVFGNKNGEICLWGRESGQPCAQAREVLAQFPDEDEGEGEDSDSDSSSDHHDNACFDSLVVTSLYVVGGQKAHKRAYVYSHSGALLRTLEEPLDASLYGMEGRAKFTFSLQLVAIGEFLLTSSMKGCALCVWDLRSGALVHRHEQPLVSTGENPDGCDACSISLARGGKSVVLAAFCGAGQHVWHFDSRSILQYYVGPH